MPAVPQRFPVRLTQAQRKVVAEIVPQPGHDPPTSAPGASNPLLSKLAMMTPGPGGLQPRGAAVPLP